MTGLRRTSSNIRNQFTGNEVETSIITEATSTGTHWILNYRGTDVATVNRFGPGMNAIQVDLYTGGWHTQTTKRRMNAMLAAFRLPFFVCIRQGTLYLGIKHKWSTLYAIDDRITLTYYNEENYSFHTDGNIRRYVQDGRLSTV